MEPPYPQSLPFRAVDNPLVLSSASRVLFLSDLHFGDGSTTDLFGDQDQRLIDFLEEQREQVEAIVFLGDIFDMPQAWSCRRIVAAHSKLVRYLRELATSATLIFVRGNHDWSVAYDEIFPGASRTEAVLFGKNNLAWHGHQVDLLMHPDASHATAKTYAHALAERIVGKRLIPPLERYDSTANRIAISLAVGWARFTIAHAKTLRTVGFSEKAETLEARIRYLARSVLGDPADLFGATDRVVLGRDFETVLCGHSHVPGVIHTKRGTYANTGTWARGMRTFATWTGTRVVVQNVDTRSEIRDEYFVNLPEETSPEDLFQWWTTQWNTGLFRKAVPKGSGRQV